MDLTEIKHISEDQIKKFDVDILIAASGYESRAVCIPMEFEGVNCKKIVLAFQENAKKIARPKNDLYFQEHQYKTVIIAGNEQPDFEPLFQEFKDHEKLNVLIDISIMTRTWYHSFLKFMGDYNSHQDIHVRLSYTAARFNEPLIIRNKISLRKFKLSNKNSKKPSSKKTALIMGLGVEKSLGMQVFEQINPDKTFLLYADPTIQKKYVENVFINNHELINLINIRDLRGYPLQDTKEIYNTLLDIVLPLRKDYRIIIVPQGAKIFALMSMVIQISYPDINLQFPQYKVKKIKDRESSGSFTAIDLLFSDD